MGHFENVPFPYSGGYPEAIAAPRASFVTLWNIETGDLRGCRGEIKGSQPLFQSVLNMTLAAALDDPRFQPVVLSEIPKLNIEINALTPLTPIKVEDIEIGRHGLTLSFKNALALLLPEVAVRHKFGREEFLKALCLKGDLPIDAWKNPDAQIMAFEAEVWSEASILGRPV